MFRFWHGLWFLNKDAYKENFLKLVVADLVLFVFLTIQHDRYGLFNLRHFVAY